MVNLEFYKKDETKDYFRGLFSNLGHVNTDFSIFPWSFTINNSLAIGQSTWYDLSPYFGTPQPSAGVVLRDKSFFFGDFNACFSDDYTSGKGSYNASLFTSNSGGETSFNLFTHNIGAGFGFRSVNLNSFLMGNQIHIQSVQGVAGTHLIDMSLLFVGYKLILI